MNLIEQLGGYNEALSLLKGCPWESGIVDVPDPRSKGMLCLDLGKLGYELLEYRRQHNIFEVGDKVVSTLDGDEFWMNFVCTIDGFHKKMIITNGGGHIIHHYEFRHATDAEIAAGHRL